jgi:hypothetical protein
MAITATVRANPESKGPMDVVPVSVKGAWQIANNSASSTAQSSSDLIRPGAVTASSVQAVTLGSRVTRVLLRCRYSAAGAVTTSPSITVFAAYGPGLCDTALPDDGTVRYVRLLSAQAVTCVAATDVRDATYSYSDPVSLTGTDLLGADYLIVFISTAASIAGAVDEVIEALLIN